MVNWLPLVVVPVFLFPSHLFAQEPVGLNGPTDKAKSDQTSTSLDTSALEQVEELSESLANTLLDFSVSMRRRDWSSLGEYLQDRIEAVPFPTDFAFPRSTKWISENSLDLSQGEVTAIDRAKLLEHWESFLDAFSEIDDVRFKVKDASFNRTQERIFGKSQVKFFLIGRDQSSRRLWVKGRGHLRASRTKEGNWVISRLTLERVDLLKASEDLFAEVSLPAGVSVSLPSYGSPGNDDFTYHGAAAGDLNEDGLIDLFVVGIGRNYLYLNQGNGRFEDVAEEAMIPPTARSTAPLLLDYDNDGDLDIFLAAVGNQMLLENRRVPEGKLLFLDASLESGVARPAVGFSAAVGDVNRDGWPDIYVNSYNLYGRVMPDSWHQASNGTANLLFLNQRDGTFKESAAAWGVRDLRWSYASQFVDVNGDRQPDLYVVNDFGENALYINQGDRFEDKAESFGVLDPGNGMGVSFGDYNNDSHLDLFVTNMSSTAGNRILDRLFSDASSDGKVLRKLAAGNSLFRGQSGSFTDVSEELGPFSAGWAWGGLFVDFDNDGWQDLYSPNGFISGKSMKDT